MNRTATHINNIPHAILTELGIGWWTFRVEEQCFILSEVAKTFFQVEDEFLSVEDFVGMLRKDYVSNIQKLMQQESLIKLEKTFPIVRQGKEIWLHCKYIEQEDGDKDAYIGSLQQVESPEGLSAESKPSVHFNDLLYQLNSISEILLSYLTTESLESIINQILEKILKQLHGDRIYVFRYEREKGVQRCLYEVIAEGVTPSCTLPEVKRMDECEWWNEQILNGKSIIYSKPEDLPEEILSANQTYPCLQQTKSSMVIPLFSRHGTWGYIGIEMLNEYHRWTENELLWFKSASNILTLFRGLDYFEKENMQEKRIFQSLNEHMPLAYISLELLSDKSGKIVDYIPTRANKAALEFFTPEVKEHIGIEASKTMPYRLEHDLGLFRKVQSNGYVESQMWLEEAQKFCHIVMYLGEKNEIICLFSDLTQNYHMHKELDTREKILSSIYKDLPVGIELYDSNGLLVNANDCNVELFGFGSKENALGINLFEDPNFPREILDKLRRKEPVAFRCTYSFDLVKKNNYYTTSKSDTIEVFIKGNLLYDKAGKVINYMLIIIDNTEINQAYSRIAEFESSFSLISKYGKIGFCKFELINRTGEGVPQWFLNLGEEPDTPVNQVIGVYNHVYDEDRQKLFGHIKRVKAGEINGFTEELRVQNPDNSWQWTQVNVMRNPASPDPAKFEMLCVNSDITNLKETEERLIEAKEKAESSDKLKSAFIANMSHEIRTPLNAIVGFSGLLAHAEDEEEKETYTSIINENNDILLQLISDILDLSKIEANVLDFSYDNVDLNFLMEEVVQTNSVKVAGTPVEIKLGESIPSCTIYSDKNRLLQVIGNFMSNAIKFTNQGSITIGFQPAGEGYIRIYVQDTGRGIASEQLESIFERFVKLDSFVQGTGLGLSICSSITKQLGGKIGATSKEGEGSCFWFTHPCKYIPRKKEEQKEASLSATKQASEELAAPKDKAVILVAEDNESNYLLIKNIIKDRYRLLHAYTGIEALDILKQEKVDMILMDINMPAMDGITATREIRKKDQTTPIVAVTAYAFDGDKQKALEAGCTDYLSKPIRPKALLQVIEDLL